MGKDTASDMDIYIGLEKDSFASTNDILYDLLERYEFDIFNNGNDNLNTNCRFIMSLAI